MKFSLNVKGFNEELTYDSKDANIISSNSIKETIVNYQYAFAEVVFREISLEDTATILISDYKLEQKGLRLQNHIKEGIIEMHFNYGNSIEIGEENRKPLQVNPMTCNLLGMKNVTGYVNFGNQKLFKTFDIHISSDFLNKFNKNSTLLDHFLKYYNKGGGVSLYPKSIPITREMQHVIKQITDCKYIEFLRLSYLKNKIEELLLLLLAPSFSSENISNTFFKISDEQISKINESRKYIEKNLTRSVSVKELSDKFRISQLKIKEGFKILFGKTVFEYSIAYKMEYASKLLKNGRSVNEVYPAVGYANHASFSYAFKKYMGIPPTNIKK